MTAPLLHIDQVGKRFGGFVALDSIELDVAPGERLERPIGFRPKDARREGAEDGDEAERAAAADAGAAER